VLTAARRDRFLAKTMPAANGCLIWTGAVRGGYGLFWMGDHTEQAHRVWFEHARWPVPEERVLDHLCRNRLCVNPDHLEPVTDRTNILRGIGPTAVNARKVLCIRGHELVPRRGGGRRCPECPRVLAREAA
jgi:hypothetical protein